MKFNDADLIHCRNTMNLMKKAKFELDAVGVVEAFHCFTWLEKLQQEIQNDLEAPKDLDEALQEAVVHKNDDKDKGPLKKTSKKAK